MTFKAIAGFLLLIFVLLGCGGGSSSLPVINNATFSIVWPARTSTPDFNLSSALSATVVFHDASANGGDIVVNVNRFLPAMAEHTDTYQVPQPVRRSVSLMTATFYAGADQQGAVVGTASAPVTALEFSLQLGTFVVVGTILNVAAISPGVLDVGAAATQLTFTATDANGDAVGVTPGSATWNVVSGGANLQVTAAGLATAAAEGTAEVTVTVDGITSPNLTITTHQPPTVTTVQVPVNDMAFDATSGKIWATVQNVGAPYGNSVVGIDPQTGVISPVIPISVEGNLIAVTNNGQYAYVSVNADATVRRVDLAAGTVPLIVSTGGPFVDLAAVPDSPNSFVTAVDPTGGVNVAVWDDNIRRTGTGAGGNKLAFAGPTTLYGQGGGSLFKNTLATGSITWNDQTGNLVDSAIEYSAADGFLYTATGRIVDPVAKVLVAQLAGTNFLIDKGVAVSDGDNRVYFVTWDNGIPKRILCFDKTTRQELPFVNTGVIPGGALNLTACGNKTVAFNLFGSGVQRNVIIVRHLP